MKSSCIPFYRLIPKLGAYAGAQFSYTLWLLFSSLLMSMLLQAQDMVITGRVTSATDNSPLIGATVEVKGTSTGTSTDQNGNYRISASRGATLTFGYIGFANREMLVGTDPVINVALQGANATMNEVVVIGYQTVRKRDLTGAASSLNTTNSAKVTSTTVAESIQGLAPGVTVNTGGAPGQGARIEIRGVASFTNANPLYVIDGMLADANTTINANDVESIQILKDASAAAIYGARAGNGVIIITTKQGREGPARVSLSAKYGIQQIPKRYDLANNVRFAELQRAQYTNSGQPIPTSVGTGFDPAINTNWQDAVLRNGAIQDYNLSLSGGNASGRYLVSGSYFQNEGYVIGRNFERSSLRINTQIKKGVVTFGENVVLTNTVNRFPPSGNPVIDMATMLPVIPIQSATYVDPVRNPKGYGIGTVAAPSFAFNPIAINQLENNRWTYSKIVGNAYLDVRLASWLNYKFNAGLEASFDANKYLQDSGIYQYNASLRSTLISEERAAFTNLLLEHTVNFNKTHGDHALNGVVGFSDQHVQRHTSIASRTNLTFNNGSYLPTLGSALGVQNSDGGTPTDYRIHGFLGRVNYTFSDRYLLTLTGRIDKDSRYGRDFRTGRFYSVAGAWRISKEAFFSSETINDLKLRASYGKLGITPFGESWPYTTFINNNPRAVFGSSQTPQVGSYQSNIANPELRWESRYQGNVGFDATMFQNAFTLTFEWYNSLTKDVLVALPVPGYLGAAGNPLANVGSIRNTGVELAATYRNNRRDFKWDVSANFTTIKNRVEEVANNTGGQDYLQSGATRSQVGHSIGQWFVIKTAGIFESIDEVLNYTDKNGTVIQPNAKAGDIKYEDLNGDGQINNDDRQYVGSPWPTLQTGAQFNASYKNFTFNLQLIGIFGQTLFNGVRVNLDGYQNTNFRADVSPWTPTNTNTNDPRIGRADIDPGIAENNRYASDRWLEKADYVRIRNVEVGYNLGSGFLRSVNINNARVYISGQNLLTITGYSGLDPDVTGANLIERGVDNGHWPSPRVISLGIQCDF